MRWMRRGLRRESRVLREWEGIDGRRKEGAKDEVGDAEQACIPAAEGSGAEGAVEFRAEFEGAGPEAAGIFVAKRAVHEGLQQGMRGAGGRRVIRDCGSR